MKYTILHPKELSVADIAAWRAIAAANARYASPYFTPEFSQIVGEVRADTRVILARDDANRIVGVFPLQLSGAGLKLARPIGAPFADYNGPVMAAGFERYAAEMLSFIGGSVYSFSGIPVLVNPMTASHQGEDTDLSSIDPDMLKYGINVRNKTHAFIADLSVGYDEYLETQRSEFPKHFKKSRRLWRQAEKEVGKLELTFHESSQEALDILIDWKREQFVRTGLHDVLGPEWSRDMIRKCFEAQLPHFSGVLTTLRCDGKLMAAEFGLRSGALLHGWISGYNSDYHSYSPGMLLQTRLLEAAANEGILTADMGVGAEHYKKYYASYLRPVCSGVLPAVGVSGALRSIGGEVWHQFENAPLGPMSNFAGKLRRRLDVILSVEDSVSGRKTGILKAFKKA